MTTTRRRLGALVTAGVLGLGLSACGGGDETGDDPGTSSAAEDTQEAEEDAAPETSEAPAAADDDAATTSEAEEEGAAAGEGEEVPIDEFLAMLQEPGEDTLASYTMTMAMQAEGEDIEAQGAVDLSGDQPAMNMTMTMAELGEIEMITVGGDIFLAMPGITPEGMYMQASEEMLGQAGALDELDVSSQWEAWEQGAQEVRFLGDEGVDGTELGHYQVTVDPAAAAEALGQDAEALSGTDTIVYDVWLDQDNLMRQLSFDLEGVMVEMSMDDWGQDQSIEAPSADQVMEMGEMPGSGSDG